MYKDLFEITYILVSVCLDLNNPTSSTHDKQCVLRCSFCSRMHTLCTDKHTYNLWLTVTGISSFFECTKMICMCWMQPINNFQLPFLGLDWLWAKYDSKVIPFQPASSTDSNCKQYVPVSAAHIMWVFEWEPDVIEKFSYLPCDWREWEPDITVKFSHLPKDCI